MGIDKDQILSAAAVRRRQAEKLLLTTKGATVPSGNKEEGQRLVHELEVHQIELEMQNAELLQARDEMAILLEQYTDLYDFAPVGYLALDRRGMICSINLTGAGLLGQEHSRLKGRRFDQFLARASRPAFAAFLDTVFISLVKETWEAALLSEGNSPRSVQIEAVVTASGEHCRLAVIDITERKRAEEELRASEERFRLFMDHSPTIAWIKDEEGRHVYVSKGFTQRLGVRTEAWQGKTDAELWHHELAEKFRRSDLALLAVDQPTESAEEIINPDGSHSSWLYTKFPFRDTTGARYVGGIGLDVTERKQAQQAIKVSEERYRALFQNLLHGFAYCRMLFDDQGDPVDFIYLEVNDAFYRLTGASDVIGKRITELFPGIRESHPDLFAIYGRVALTGQSETFDLEFEPLKMWLTVAVYSVASGYFSVTFGNITQRKRLEQELHRNLREISALKQQVDAENFALRAEIRERLEPGPLLGSSAALRKILAQAEQLAPTDITVLLQGETGTGKELIARYLHQHSGRRQRNLYPLSCAAIPDTLMESELFGHEKGAFTGAQDRRLGHFELADQATIFLDEIGELSLEAQSKLLRVLQEGEFCRLGSPKTLKTDVRVIAATNRNLAEEVRLGRFREDLYYRLSVFPLTIPPLRERSEDIPQLVWAFAHELGVRMGKNITRISDQEMTALQQYSWPGNVRELRNVIEHALIFSTDETLHIRLPESPTPGNRQPLSLQALEYQHITEILRSTSWRVYGPKGAARLLGLNPTTLYSRMKKLGIPCLNKIDDI